LKINWQTWTTLILFCWVFCDPLASHAQTLVIYGTVTDSIGQPIPDVAIYTNTKRQSTVSSESGYFNLIVQRNLSKEVSFSHIQYFAESIDLSNSSGDSLLINMILRQRTKILNQVSIYGSAENTETQAGAISINPKGIESVPSPFQDISRILVTLPGVSANNELSSTYAVRGGNYEENLIYVNDIPIYRPFLIRVGEQEGLGFVNTDLVENIDFYAGGWQAKYGDKLSSSLNVTYKDPTKRQGSISAGLLGGSFSYAGLSDNRRIRTIVGLRHKDSRYILNSLEVKGQYFPTFTDLQSFTTIDLSKAGDGSSELSVLLSYARNRYETFPVSRETDFGTLSASFRLFVAFEGTELMKYDTYQSGFKWTKKLGPKFTTNWIASGVSTSETERFEVEGGYRLCDINTNPGSATFDECVVTRGVGSNYRSGRNSLDASIFNLETKNKLIVNSNNIVEMGASWGHFDIKDQLQEYTFIDSADFVSIDERSFTNANITSNQFAAYAQHGVTSSNDIHTLTYGVRLNYWDYNGQLLVSPRLQYAFKPQWTKPLVIRMAVGSYQQPPFYRELRNRAGQINPTVEAQSSVHYILGSEYSFSLWGRNFVFFNELYYKHLYNLNLYDIENVRLRYFANNNATGYAAGLDMRVHGEFIPGVESWFSLGLLSTKENNLSSNLGNVRRPSDQRINLSIYFQDHMPNDPSLRIALTLLYGSGFPFGPPKVDQLRNAFSGDEYYRADVGFYKVIDKIKDKKPFGFNSLRLGVEILNMFGAENTISYTWVKDVNSNQFAVPNGLSARFLNVRVQGFF
jgi:hypothetical protein